MLDFLRLFVHVLEAPFLMQARLEAEITMLRHQLMCCSGRHPGDPG
jgi:hypothetical protein